ncbi:hypothetical protein ACI2UK_24465 [Ralstonia nicotianae]|uniref:hypothetical protein n=1 Tax=Ralstonia pseudosolanacearum TaxID=1310165 RepID=UPI002005E5EA|nr:hypothetical protein [Ralstonia pseudosolanacearum]MCK4120405.1 hypothetical protein [Ralstonia pseudosolanacearum]
MRKLIVAVFALLLSMPSFAGWFGPDTFDACVLDEMPGVSNAIVAKLVLANCAAYARAKMGSGRGLLARYKSGLDCFADKGKGVGDALASNYVLAACHQLYDPPTIDQSQVIPDTQPGK